MKRKLTLSAFLAAGLAVVILAAGASAVSIASNRTKETSGVSANPVSGVARVASKVSPEDAARAIASAKELSTAFRVAADQVLPAVVTIETTPRAVPASEGPNARNENPYNGTNPFEGTPFEDFFRDSPMGKGFRFDMPPMRPQPHRGMGSGVIIDPSGLILTNNHVVAGGGEVSVRLYDGREFKASAVYTDPKSDIAVVKLDDAKNLVAAKLGDSEKASVGDWVLALGQPFGLESSVTAGIISALHRGIGITARENFIQTDAAMNPGNSGGPLVNLDGEVIGINTAISSQSGGSNGVGFAVPVNLAKWVADQLAKGGTVRRAYLGVGIQPVTAAIAHQFNVKPREGVVVTEVYPNTPAARSGLKSGDVIVEYGGVTVTTPQELQLAVERSQIGRQHYVTIIRDGKRMDLPFTPEEQPNSFGAVGRSMNSESNPQTSKLEKLGLELSSLDESVAERLGMKGIQGVVITEVRPGSPADRAGLESGMAITHVSRKPVKTVAEATKAMESQDSTSGVLLLVRTAEGPRFFVLQP
jgi:serine protease Do